jgi:5'(3')-deoxyribonucleotidase
LLIVSDELLIEELFNHVQAYLVEKQTEWIQENFSFILHIAFKLTNCKKLLSYVQDYLIENQTEWIQKKFPFILHIVFKLTNYEK